VFDAEFKPYQYNETKRRSAPYWLRIQSADSYRPSGDVPVLIIHKGRHIGLQLFTKRAGTLIQLAVATELPQFRAAHDVVFLLPDGLSAGQSFYARVEPRDTARKKLIFRLPL